MREPPAIQIDADISRAWSIPAVFYTDPEVWARENEIASLLAPGRWLGIASNC